MSVHNDYQLFVSSTQQYLKCVTFCLCGNKMCPKLLPVNSFLLYISNTLRAYEEGTFQTVQLRLFPLSQSLQIQSAQGLGRDVVHQAGKKAPIDGGISQQALCLWSLAQSAYSKLCSPSDRPRMTLPPQSWRFWTEADV